MVMLSENKYEQVEYISMTLEACNNRIVFLLFLAKKCMVF